MECGATDGTGIPRLSICTDKCNELGFLEIGNDEIGNKGAGKEVKSKAERKAAEAVWEMCHRPILYEFDRARRSFATFR